MTFTNWFFDMQNAPRFFVIANLVGLFFMGSGSVATISATPQADPLPSWTDGDAKATILSFVKEVTDPSSSSFVEADARIATFDNDGTLWAEKPIYFQIAFVFRGILEQSDDHPEWSSQMPFKAVLENDLEALKTLPIEDVATLAFASYTEMTQSEFSVMAEEWLTAVKHPRFGVLYKELAYAPMVELLDYLRANEFRPFIVSGGGIEFIRVFSREAYGIPPEQVIGSSLKYEFVDTETGSELMRRAEVVSLNDAHLKPVNIQLHIGRRPILAFGNSNGDIEMLKYTADGDGSRLSLLLHHDDAEREYAYDHGTERALEVAEEEGWTVVSVKNDFDTVFSAVH
jgi:phosphoglycolate phosphatase-like HAD superfamily hydrolase